MTAGQQRFFLCAILAGALLQVSLLFSSIPLGVPGEWAWSRIPAGTVLAFNLGFTLFVLLLYYFFLRFGIKKIAHCSSLQKGILLTGLCFASLIVSWNLKAAPGGIFGPSGMSWITYYPRMSGYFTEAVSSAESTKEFLARYEQIAEQGDYLHQGTHPPGLIIGFRLLHQWCKSSPKLTKFLMATETEQFAYGLDILDELTLNSNNPLTPEKRATLSLSVLLTLLFTAGTVVPIYLFLVRTSSSEVAFAFSGLWALVPAVSLFAPKSDLLLAFLSAWLVMLWTQSVSSRKWFLGFLAGIVLWVGMMISLAIIVVPVILSIWTLLQMFKGNPEMKIQSDEKKLQLFDWKSVPVVPLISILVGLVIPCLLMLSLFDLNLLSVWKINLSKHAEFYEHNTRTYFLWLLVNPIELAFSVGMPLFILFFVAVLQGIRDHFRSLNYHFAASVLAVWLLLHLTGKNMGEAARLWIFLLPLILLAGGQFLGRNTQTATQPERETKAEREQLASPFPLTLWTVIFITQAAVAVASLCAIDAFDFTAI